MSQIDLELTVDQCSSNPDKKNDAKELEIIQDIPSPQVGLLVNDELQQALKECREKVKYLAQECRKANRKFRDIEFDLENDRVRCQYGLYSDGPSAPPDVRRVTEIFENPKFFEGEPHSNDIIQGALGDCWFLSALSTLTTAPELLKKLCIARDEKVGIYGFVFFRDSHWVHVIIDDQLFCNTPKFEELGKEEQQLYQDDKEVYEKLTRRSGRGLLYAKSGGSGETWVPLLEKAYAKLHGDYQSLAGGTSSEGLEDLTGGISLIIRVSDILDPDEFWTEELMKVNNNTHLFGVSFPALDDTRNGLKNPAVEGLFGSHAYSILRVKECRGKRFVVLRNPWGETEWKGRWADGSKEWTGDWLEVLQELDHVLGNDGEFVMEYEDFLNTWTDIQRTRVFNSSWVMSSRWISIPHPPLLNPWTHGDISFSFTLPKASTTIIVLSQLDSRFFQSIDGVASLINLDFAVYRRGETEIRGVSHAGRLCSRSTCCELDLEEGEYIVYPRIDYVYVAEKGYYEEGFKLWDKRKLSRVLSERTKGRAIASNYELESKKKFIPLSINDIVDADDKDTKPTLEQPQNLHLDSSIATTTTTTTVTTTVTTITKQSITSPSGTQEDTTSNGGGELEGPDKVSFRSSTINTLWREDASVREVTLKKADSTDDDEDQSPLVMGLKIYTKKGSVVTIIAKHYSKPI